MDLNADLGEHDGNGYESDIALLDLVTSASIACGAHAGSDEVMRNTARAAADRGVVIGAHPGYRDRAGFGRREMAMPAASLAAEIVAQVMALAKCCDAVGARLRYVKPHGALYNTAARDQGVALTIAAAMRDIDRDLIVLTLPRCALAVEARTAGLTVALEAFIDRNYEDDGSLVPRGNERATIRDAAVAADRALAMVRDGVVTSISGAVVSIDPDSLCVHSDSVNALAIVSATRSRLERAGFPCAPFAR